MPFQAPTKGRKRGQMSIKRIAVLGSTGSIGRQTLEVVGARPDRFRVVALGAGGNLSLLARQIQEYGPSFVSIGSRENKGVSFGDKVKLLSMEEIARHPEVDLVVVATVGKVGLFPTLAALEAGKMVALANKEVLVMAGAIVMEVATKNGGTLLPVDSEHSALWQCLRGEDGSKTVSRLILTASGGPFWGLPPESLAQVTPQEALRHPIWQMGPRITVDSATLMNKGMEVIEAHWLFQIPMDRIEILVHREGTVHSLVEFVDGSVKAQLGPPDMRLPLQYALSYPERWENPQLPQLNLVKQRPLTFQAVDLERFPCLSLALEAGKRGGTYPAVLSTADEVAVELFLKGRIGLMDIPKLVERALDKHQGPANAPLEEILWADEWAREYVRGLVI